jgi:hypothetical protein
MDSTLESGADSRSVEERIRTRAYYLWENTPDPKGTPDEYWDQARAEIQNEGGVSEMMDTPVDPADQA